MVHRSRSIHPEDRAVRDGIPVTSLARTLLDLADVVNAHRLQRAFERAERRELLDLRALDRVLERSRGRRGLKVLLPLLADLRPAPHTRSELETRVLELIRQAGLPEPICNTQVEGYEVDMLWPKAKLILELDGYEFHKHRTAFHRDRERGLALESAGFRVLRASSSQLDHRPDLIVNAIRNGLA